MQATGLLMYNQKETAYAWFVEFATHFQAQICNAFWRFTFFWFCPFYFKTSYVCSKSLRTRYVYQDKYGHVLCLKKINLFLTNYHDNIFVELFHWTIELYRM